MIDHPILVKIIAAPIACKDGIKESWRQVAEFAARQIHTRYGDQVMVQYFDLFDPGYPALPPNSQLPVVFVNENVLSTGGKISIPLICKTIEELGATCINL